MSAWKIFHWLEDHMAAIGSGLCLFLMMNITVISVLGRYVLGMDLIPGAFNMIERVLFPLMVFWAMPLAYRSGAFPRLAFIVEKLETRRRAAVGIVVILVEFAIFLALLYYTGMFALEGVESQLTAPVGTNYWPIYPVLLMVPLAFAFMLVEMLRRLWADIRDVVNGGAGS